MSRCTTGAPQPTRLVASHRIRWEVINAAERDAYELVSFTVNGEPDRSAAQHAKTHRSTPQTSARKQSTPNEQDVDITYVFRTLTRQDGNLLFIDLEQPTHNATFIFDYTNTTIAEVSALDLLPTERASRIERSPTDTPIRTIRVETHGWTFPRAGVAFVWR